MDERKIAPKSTESLTSILQTVRNHVLERCNFAEKLAVRLYFAQMDKSPKALKREFGWLLRCTSETMIKIGFEKHMPKAIPRLRPVDFAAILVEVDKARDVLGLSD